MRKNKFKIALLFLSLILSGCNKNKQEETGGWKSLTIDTKIKGYRSTNKTGQVDCYPFDTSMVVRYYFEFSNENNDEIENNVINIYNQEIVRLHKIFDRHYYYFDDDKIINNLKVLNDSYGSEEEIVVPIELFNLLKFAIENYEITNGMFNIFTASLTDYWEECFSAANNFEDLESFDPSFNDERKEKLEEIVDAIPNTKEEYESMLTFNEENTSVKFNKLKDSIYPPLISLGGIAKGYATDLVKEKLVEANYTNGVLYSGGSSLSSLSSPIHSNETVGQEIKVKNPNTFDDYAFSLKANKEYNFSTSGNYTTDKYYWFLEDFDNLNSNRIYRHHIINPKTGYPEPYYRSVSVITYDLSSAYVDMLTTALMNLDINSGLEIRSKLLQQNKGLEIVYLKQTGSDSLSVFATNNILDLKLNNGVQLINEQ